MLRVPCARQLMAGAIVVCVAGTAHAAFISPGLYQLSDHRDGSAAPPLYGLRLDELFDEDPQDSTEEYTFSFDHAQSAVTMTVGESQSSPGDIAFLQIQGFVYGGRDIGSGWAPEGPNSNTGRYQIAMRYDVGVQLDSNDDDVVVIAPDASNTGWIRRVDGNGNVIGEQIPLFDKSNGNFSFRFGDKDDDSGHRGNPGISGWGWVNHRDPNVHHAYSDWLFEATFIDVPTPGAAALLVAGVGIATRRRKA